jgi:hypothetical protein
MSPTATVEYARSQGATRPRSVRTAHHRANRAERYAACGSLRASTPRTPPPQQLPRTTATATWSKLPLLQLSKQLLL